MNNEKPTCLGDYPLLTNSKKCRECNHVAECCTIMLGKSDDYRKKYPK